MAWTWELGGRFIRLTFRNEMGTAPKVNVFEGHAYYRPVADGQYRGMWFDNSGMFRPLDAKRDGDALVSKWGTPDTEEGETTYRLREDGTMEVVDRVKGKDGTWRDFGRATYRRVNVRLRRPKIREFPAALLLEKPCVVRQLQAQLSRIPVPASRP